MTKIKDSYGAAKAAPLQNIAKANTLGPVKLCRRLKPTQLNQKIALTPPAAAGGSTQQRHGEAGLIAEVSSCCRPTGRPGHLAVVAVGSAEPACQQAAPAVPAAGHHPVGPRRFRWRRLCRRVFRRHWE